MGHEKGWSEQEALARAKANMPPEAENPMPGTADDPFAGQNAPDQSEYGVEDPPLGLPFKQQALHPYDGKLPDKYTPPWGGYHTKLPEKQPIYNVAPCEKVIEGENNSRIILGRDRDIGVASGYGARGHTRSGAVDIVVGLQGWKPDEGGEWKFPVARPPKWIDGYADKNFGSMNNDKPGDAARIYISQRADIDKYFDICPGNVGMSTCESAIGMKADSVRILARKGIKLVTAKNPPGRNSIDGKIKVVYGIDLIAGNRDIKTGLEGLSIMNPEFGTEREIEYLQPIPKGLNLVEYLTHLHGNVQYLNSIMAGYLTIIPYLTRAVLNPSQVITATGAGYTMPFATPWVVSDVSSYLVLVYKQYMKLYKSQLKMVAIEQDYLTPKGSLWVLSRHNRSN